MSDIIRMGLRLAEGEKAGALAFYVERQNAGTRVPLRAGTVALLQDVHDEQELRLDCIKQAPLWRVRSSRK